MRTMKNYLRVLLVLSSLVFGVLSAHAQSAVVTRPVQVAVLENSPILIRPSENDSANAREYGALAIRLFPTAGDTSVIQISPAYLNASTLGLSLNILRSCSGARKGAPPRNLEIVVRASRGKRDVAAKDSSALSAWIAQLESQPIERIYKMADKGRSIVIPGVSVCVRVPETRMTANP